MKRLVTFVVIVGQWWITSPFCCCSLKVAQAASTEKPNGSCCCAKDEKAPETPRQREQDDCRCRFEHRELTTPRVLAALDRPERAPSFVWISSEAAGDWLFGAGNERFVAADPPPRAGVQLLYERQHLNL